MMKIIDALLPILEKAWGSDFIDELDQDDFVHVMGLYGVKFTAAATAPDEVTVGESAASPAS